MIHGELRDDFMDRRSSWRPVCFNFRSAGVNQGEEVLKVTFFLLRGARLLREASRVELRRLSCSSGELRFESRGRVEDSRSERCWGSTERKLRKMMFLGGGGVADRGCDDELYEFVVREGKGAGVEVEYWEVGGADKVKDVSFIMGGEGDMLGK